MQLDLGLSPTLYEVEKSYILRRFAELGNNRTRTANALGIGLRTLQRKLDRYGIPKGTVGFSK